VAGEEPPGQYGARPFPYHKSVAPILWVFVGLASIELLVTHFVLSFWSPTAALVLSGLTLASIGWFVLLIQSMRRLPVLLDERRLVMRVGTLRCIEVPVEAVAGLRTSFDDAALRHREVANLALLAWPNVFVELAEPVRQGDRAVRAVAHKLDDGPAFTAELTRLLQARQGG